MFKERAQHILNNTGYRLFVCMCALLVYSVFFIPTHSLANPGKTTTCLDCHGTLIPGATNYVAVDGAEHDTASNYVLSSYTGAAQDVEIDWFFKDATNSVSGESIAFWTSVPSGWAFASGTVNSPTGTNFTPNWSNTWDIATSNGGGAGETYYAVKIGDPTYYPNSPDSYSIYWNDHAGSAWDMGKNKGAYDDGVAGNPGDQDGQADTMGTDFIITVPAGLGAGTTHEIVVEAIGHTTGGTKAHSTATLTIEIPSGGDSTPPTSTITDPTDAATLNSASADPYTITGTASDNVAVNLVEVNINGGGWLAATDTGGGDWSTWSFSWTLPADGSYNIQSRATDTASTPNVETPGAGNTVTVDRTALSVSSTVPTDTATDVALDSNVTINFNDDVDCATVNTTNITSDSPGWTFSTCSAAQAVFTTSGQASSTTYNVNVTTNVTDDAGNPMGSAYPFSYTTAGAGDSTPPTSNITDPADSAILNSASSDPYIITGTASDNIAVNLVEVNINGGGWQAATDTGGGDWSTWSYSWTLPADGSYTIQSRATDTASTPNVETPSAGNTVTVDRTALSVSSTVPTDTATDVAIDSNVTINFNDDVDCATVNTTNITSTSPGWTFSTCSAAQAVFTTSGQANVTTYNVSVTTAVNDDAGNAMGAQYNFSYTTGDFVEPSSTIIDPTDSATLNSASADPYTITGTASDNIAVNLVEVSIDGGAWTAATDTGGGDWSTWSYSWTLPADGSYTIESRATDTSSNQEGGGAGNAGISVTVDRTAPTFSGVTGATDAASGGAVDLTWNTATEATSPPVTYNIYYSTTSGGQNFSTPDATSSNATGDTVTGLTNDQIYYFVVKAKDNVGNESSSPTEMSATPTAPLSCVFATPSVTILTADKDIAFDGGLVKYTVRVTNNDSVECSPTNFNLTVVDSNSTNFYPSTADISPLNVSPQSFAETTIRVTAKSNQTNGPTNATYFYTDADGSHSQSANSNSVTTTINVTGVGCLTDGSIVNGNGDQLIMSR